MSLRKPIVTASFDHTRGVVRLLAGFSRPLAALLAQQNGVTAIQHTRSWLVARESWPGIRQRLEDEGYHVRIGAA